MTLKEIVKALAESSWIHDENCLMDRIQHIGGDNKCSCKIYEVRKAARKALKLPPCDHPGQVSDSCYICGDAT